MSSWFGNDDGVFQLADLIPNFLRQGDRETRETISGIAGILAGLGNAAGINIFDPKTMRGTMGYQGSIPRYTAHRTAVDHSADREAGRRPGSAGRRYFSDTRYALPGEAEDVQAAVDAQAQGLASLNTGNREEVLNMTNQWRDPYNRVLDRRNDEYERLLTDYNDYLASRTPPNYPGPGPGPGDTDPGDTDPGDTDPGDTDPDDTGSSYRYLVPGGLEPPRALDYDTELTMTPHRKGSWVYDSEGNLTRSTEDQDVYKVHMGDGQFNFYTDLADAQAAAANIYGDEYLDYVPDNTGDDTGGDTGSGDEYRDRVPDNPGDANLFSAGGMVSPPSYGDSLDEAISMAMGAPLKKLATGTQPPGSVPTPAPAPRRMAPRQQPPGFVSTPAPAPRRMAPRQQPPGPGIAGLVASPTDGMADQVPAVIGGREPAALSGGEVVIPADVVSGIGNGNTMAGAKALEGLMANVRQARTGTPRQAPSIDLNQFMKRVMR